MNYIEEFKRILELRNQSNQALQDNIAGQFLNEDLFCIN